MFKKRQIIPRIMVVIACAISAILISLVDLRTTINSLTIELMSDQERSFHLYYDTGSGYNEQESVAGKVLRRDDKQATTYHFPIPHDKTLIAIRIDPDEQPARYLIKKISLNYSYDSKRIYPHLTWNAGQIEKLFVPLHNVKPFVLQQEHLLVETEGPDPYFGTKENLSETWKRLTDEQHPFTFPLKIGGYILIALVAMLFFLQQYVSMRLKEVNSLFSSMATPQSAFCSQNSIDTQDPSSCTPTMKKQYFITKIALLSMLGVPVVFIILFVNTRHLQGAYHQAFFSDPSYAYLLNSLNIVNGELPGHTDHPGTTVQLLGGLVLKVDFLIGKLRGEKQNYTIKVLQDPESYIEKISNVFISIVAITVFLFGMQVYRVTKRLALAIIAQAFPLSFSSLLEHLPRLEPEPLLVASAYLLATILVPLVTNPVGKAFHLRRTALMTGTIMGIGVVTKVTFAPLLLLLFVLRGYKAMLFTVLALVSTIIILTIPIWTVIPKTVSLFIRIMTHSGRYGYGEVGLPSASSLLANGIALWKDAPIMLCFMPALLLSLFTFKQDINYSELRRFLVVLLVVLTSLLAITIKHPSVHYLMPTMALSGFMALIISLTFPWRNNRLFIIIISIMCIFIVHKAIRQTDEVFSKYQITHNEFSQLKQVAQKYGCLTVNYYRSSSKEYALSFGNIFSRDIYKKELAKLYPKFMNYDIWQHYFSTFKGKCSLTEMNDLLHKDDPICLMGTDTLPYNGEPKVRMLENKEGVKLYQFLGWNIQSVINQIKN